MRRFQVPVLVGVLAAFALSAVGPAAAAQSAEEFYKSKRVTVLIASSAGGGYDGYGRALARHLGKYIPGNPNVVAQNMDGAAGLTATNHLANKADRDGSVILATYNGLTVQPLIDPKGTLYDPLTLNWIGSMGRQTNICVTWHTSPITKLEQTKTTEIPVSSTGATGNSATVPNILNHLLGTKFKVIIGYDTSGQRLALERGEVGGICGLSYSTLMASNPDWILDKKLNILVQFGMGRSVDLPDVPGVTEFVKDPNDRKILELLAAPQEMGRPIAAPPEVPADRVQALRRAFDATMKDPQFLEEAKKTFLFIDPMTGEQVTDMIKQIYTTPKDVLAKAAELMSAIPVEKKKN